MVTKEKFTVSGDRRVRIRHKDKTLIDIPLAVGAPVAAVGIIALPVLAAIGALAALLSEATIEVEKVEEKPAPAKKSAAKPAKKS
jgi:hypothetical protein